MPTSISPSLALIRRTLAEYSDVPEDQIVPEAELATLQIDSLTLAEMLFSLEDAVGQPMAEPTQPPARIADLMALVEPYMDALQKKAQA